MVATVRGNRGLLLLRTGELEAARQELDAALGGMTDAREMVPVLLNRGSLNLETGDLEAAVRDFERCRDLVTDDAEAVFRPMAEHNLGYAWYLRGDLPAALRSMDRAAAAAPPEHAGVGLMDKAVVLYEAGLLTDAEDALRRAVELLAATRGSRDLLDAQLARARCLVGLGRHQDALVLARRARTRARRVAHPILELRAQLVALDARHGLLQASGVASAFLRLAITADRLQARAAAVPGGERLRAEAALISAEALARTGRWDESSERLRRLPALADLALGTRVRIEVVRALDAFGGGDRRSGVAAVRRGQQLLASQRLRLGAVEAVTAAAAHGLRLQVVDIDAALATGRADAVFDALERGRATFAGSGRVRPPDDPETAALVVTARRFTERARLIGADDAVAQARLQREARRLQNRARERAWYSGGEAQVPRPATARDLRAELRESGSDRTVLNLALVRGTVMAVRVDRSGSRLFELGAVDEVLEHARRVRADQEVLANPLIPPPLHDAALRSLTRGLAWLDRTLLQAAGVEGPVYVAARDRFVSLPWASLPSRRGTSTVVNSWVARGAADWKPGPGLVVAGPDLRHAAAEAAAVAGVWGTGTAVLTGADATCDTVASAVGGVPIVHLAAHGSHEPDNPVFSSVRLADGPLFAHELDGRDLTHSVVVLSACDVGGVSVRQGGEPLGLTSVLLRMGARAVVASVAPLRDDVAVRVMPALHSALRDGLRPGQALARAVADEPEPVPLVCFGPLVL
jgi:tetratricopeptide (TPR) repeat protein